MSKLISLQQPGSLPPTGQPSGDPSGTKIEAHYQLPVSTQAFKLLPNPAQRHVTVFSAMPASGTVSVYAPDGMLATPSQPLTGHYTTLNIDLLPAGCYEVRIFTDTETKSLKLITLKN